MKDNLRLRNIFKADQAERKTKEFDWFAVMQNDTKRRNAVLHMIEKGQVRTATDHYHAAMIFHHASTIKDLRRAKRLCFLAIKKGEERAKWLYAAATDRLLVKMHKKQKFGTQYLQITAVTKKGKSKREQVLFSYDKRTTDATRAAYNVPSLRDLVGKPRSESRAFSETPHTSIFPPREAKRSRTREPVKAKPYGLLRKP